MRTLRGVSRAARPGTPVIVAVLCAIAPDRVAADPARIASECMEAGRIEQRVNLNAGVYNESVQVASPMMLDIPVGVDARRVGLCLEAQDAAPITAEVTFAEREAACREARQHRAQVRLDAAGGTTIGESDGMRYHDCLRGEEAEIEVDVAFPAATPR